MSLTSFLLDNADVRERFRREFRKPEFSVKKELIAPSLTTNYRMVGTAFDYLLRFLIQRLNPHAIQEERWVAERALDELAHDALLFAKAKRIVSRARKRLGEYLKTGRMSGQLIWSALSLATLDPILRAGVGQETVGVVHRRDVQDLKNLLGAVDHGVFTARKLCMLNPTFGWASDLVAGADADLVIDDTIIDVKTTKELSLERRALDQVLGYYVLHYIGGVGASGPTPRIRKVAIYFSRYGYLHVMRLSQLVNPKTFPRFVRWFERRAGEEFPEEFPGAGVYWEQV